MSASRGVTLLEALLTCALLGLFLTLILQVVVPAGRATTRGSEQAEVQQLASVTLDRLGQELRPCTPAGVTFQNGYLSLQPLVDVDTDGRQMWARELIVYHWDGQGLNRRTWPPGPPQLARTPQSGQAFNPSGAQLARIGTEGAMRRVAAGMTDFQVQKQPDGTVVVEVEFGAGQQRFRLQRRVLLMNS